MEWTELDQKYYEYLQGDKWRAIAKRRLEIDGFVCQGCGSRGGSNNPLQIHHMTYRHIFEEENYVYTDLVCLCRNCHGTTHAILNRVTSSTGRRGWRDEHYVPNINVYVLSGADIQQRRENLANDKLQKDG